MTRLALSGVSGCQVDGCTNPVRAKGLCNAHYQQGEPTTFNCKRCGARLRERSDNGLCGFCVIEIAEITTGALA
jgi:hypothetical protein